MIKEYAENDAYWLVAENDVAKLELVRNMELPEFLYAFERVCERIRAAKQEELRNRTRR